jgi:MoxR-like ATPase
MENDNAFENRVDLERLQESVTKLKAAIGEIIIGQEKAVDLIISAILANGHILVEGVPGVAKTLISRLVAQTIDADYSRIQFTPDLMPSDILGTSVFNMKSSTFEFSKGPVFSQIILIDEINRAPAKTQAALFEVMEERQITIDGTTYTMTEPFLIMATQNPIEQEGTYRLPEAQLDRFLFKINMGYPELEEEILILSGHHKRGSVAPVDSISKVILQQEILEYRQQVQAIHIEEPLLAYIARMIRETRQNHAIYLGGSPRASVNLMNAAKAYAAIQGRDFVIPDDIIFMVNPVLRHRIILTPEKEMEGGTTDEVLEHIVEKIEIPR